MKVKWIFFDIGSTLVDETACYQKRYAAMAESAGVAADAIQAMAEAHFRAGRKGDAEAARHFGVPLPKWPKAEERLYPQTVRVLDALKRRGYRLGVIANQSPGTEERLTAWGIRAYFDVILASAEEGVSKPDTGIFKRALARAQCNAAEAAMVGDRIDNDIVPAKALGMQTVLIRQGPRREVLPETEGECANWTAEKLDELLDIWDGDA